MYKMNAGELKKMLEDVPDDWDITFSGGLEFYRLKRRGDKLLQIEFNQHVYRGEDGKWIVVGE